MSRQTMEILMNRKSRGGGDLEVRGKPWLRVSLPPGAGNSSTADNSICDYPG